MKDTELVNKFVMVNGTEPAGGEEEAFAPEVAQTLLPCRFYDFNERGLFP